jgi:OmpA-OmpF porin, OOP family
MKNRKALYALGLAAAFFSLPAAAQLGMSSVYIGGSLGRSHFTSVCPDGVECTDRDTEFSFFTGLAFSRYLAVEAGYRDFGHATVGTSDIKANALELDAVGNFPLFSRLSLVGRVGVYHGKMKGATEERKNGGTFGWGVQYDVSQQTGLRAEWQRYSRMGGNSLPTTNLDSFSVSALFRFR